MNSIVIAVVIVVVLAIVVLAVKTLNMNGEIKELEVTLSVQEDVIQYHGLQAFSDESVSLLGKVDTCLEEGVIICGSNKAIGDIGIVFEGSIHRAFEGDVFSTIESRNETDTTGYVSTEDYVASCKKLGKIGYMETHTQVKKIVGIWCNTNSMKEEALALAEALGVAVVTLKKSQIV